MRKPSRFGFLHRLSHVELLLNGKLTSETPPLTQRTLTLSDVDTTDDVYAAVARKLAVPVSDESSLLLTYGGKPLRQGMLLGDYGIHAASTLDLLRAEHGLIGGSANGPNLGGAAPRDSHPKKAKLVCL
jgi:hypothetical protein